MRLQGCVSIITIGALLTGCPGMSKRDNERFQALVAKNASPGMPFVTGNDYSSRAIHLQPEPAAESDGGAGVLDVAWTRSRVGGS